MRSRRSALAAVIVLACALCVPGQATAQFCPVFLPPWPEGCSIHIPLFIQNGLNWIFLDACNNHDLCWAQPNPLFGPCLGYDHKFLCDAAFLFQMEAACAFWATALSFPGSGWVNADDFLDNCSDIAIVFAAAVNTPWGFEIFRTSQCCRGCNANLCGGLYDLPQGCGIGCGSGGPGPCNSTYEQTQLIAVDLDSGRVLHPGEISTRGLSRTKTVDDDTFFLEEWVVTSTEAGQPVLAPRGARLGASSLRARDRAEAYAAALSETPGARAGRRYLVIEAARHIDQLTEPLVKLESLRTGQTVAAGLPDGRVTLRARFSPQGALEDVQVIEGSPRAARRLAEDLRVEFPLRHEHARMGHDGHRAVIFATFEVAAGESELVSSVPVLPQCCCPEWPMCPV